MVAYQKFETYSHYPILGGTYQFFERNILSH